MINNPGLNFRIVVLGLLLVVAGCGGAPDIKFETGPRLQSVLSKHDQDLKSGEKRAVYLKKVETCGVGAESMPPKGEQNFQVSLEFLNTNPPKPVTVITTKIFSLEDYRKAYEARRVAIQNADFLNKQTFLGTMEFHDRDPVVIRANCIFIHEGETLRTKGDLYLVAGMIKVEGTIITTPNTVDDQPGAPGGSVYIAGTEVDLGLHHLFSLNGAAAGLITSRPAKIIMENDDPALKEIREKVREQFVESSKVPTKREFKRPDTTGENDDADARRILRSWIKVRPHFTLAEPFKLEAAVYTREHLGQASSRVYEFVKICLDNNVKETDYTKIFRNPELSQVLVRAWQSSIAESKIKFAGKKESEYSFLSNWHQVTIIESSFDEKLNSNAAFEISGLQYQPLKGGSPGSLHIYEALSKGHPKIDQNFGAPFPREASDALIFPEYEILPSLLYVPLLRTQATSVLFFESHTDNDDKARSQSIEGEPEVSPPFVYQNESFKLVEKKSVDAKWISIKRIVHPNASSGPGEIPFSTSRLIDVDAPITALRLWGLRPSDEEFEKIKENLGVTKVEEKR